MQSLPKSLVFFFSTILIVIYILLCVVTILILEVKDQPIRRPKCSDYAYQEDAQAVFDKNPKKYATLDGSKGTKGKPCEDLPSRN